MEIQRGRQQRIAAIHNFRAVGLESARSFAATVLRYDTPDEYGTMFSPECFVESMGQRMPRVVWGHDWTDPIGVWTTWENVTDDLGVRLDMVAQLDDFAAVPRARQAYAQLKSGTIDQFSIGFDAMDGEMALVDGMDIVRFTKGRLDEASLVIVGAVPGTTLLAVRHPAILVRGPEPVITKDRAAGILLDLHAGKLDLADALQEIKSAQAVPPAGEAPPPASEAAGTGEDAPGAAGVDTSSPGASAEPETDLPEPDPNAKPSTLTDGEAPPPADGAGEGSTAGTEANTTEPFEMDWTEFADVDEILANL